MIAQDTGSAIIGPARADLYFGAGPDAGKLSGRLRHNMRFVMLVPKSLDPSARARNMPLPDPRPSERIAKLRPQTRLAGDGEPDRAPAAQARSSAVAQAQTAASLAAPIPLPEARPATAPSREVRHHRVYRGYR